MLSGRPRTWAKPSVAAPSRSLPPGGTTPVSRRRSGLARAGERARQRLDDPLFLSPA
jgi:hypothetical protein